LADVTFTWLGHGSYRFDSAAGKRIYVDPWFDNPKCPEQEKQVERCDVLAITHGHADHVGSAVDVAKQHSPTVVAIFELASWLESQGAPNASQLGSNKGGTVEAEGVKFTMTNAEHSSGFGQGDGSILYLGDPVGYVVEFENGLNVYCAGDTAPFSDMQLIGRLHSPDVAILPIGDHFTMGPKGAALALELLGAKRCIPVHWGTFPLLRGTPDQLRDAAPGVEVLAAEPGETITL
jgi:L-ascorbate metabolism protein UlaG (beta-lactamase superfamily)